MISPPAHRFSAEAAGLTSTIFIPDAVWGRWSIERHLPFLSMQGSATAQIETGPVVPDLVTRTLLESLGSACFPTDLARVRDLISVLESRSRQLVIFATGLTGLANQSIAQFTGWSIPGVGEGANRSKPRTRLYDTTDPDTLSQLVASLNFDACALIFIAGTQAEATHVQARTVLAQAQDRIGREALCERLACLHARAGKLHDRELASLVAGNGGYVVEVDGCGDALSPLGLFAGVARDLGVLEIRRGAGEVIERASDAGDWASLTSIWSGLGNLLASSGAGFSKPPDPSSARMDRNGPSAMIVPYADRLSRFAAWAGAYRNIALAEGPAIGPGGGPVRRGPAVAVAPQSMHGQDLRGLGIRSEAGAMIDIVGVAFDERLADAFLAEGHMVRLLSLSDYGPRAFGALIGLAMVDAQLAAAGVEIRE